MKKIIKIVLVTFFVTIIGYNLINSQLKWYLTWYWQM